VLNRDQRIKDNISALKESEGKTGRIGHHRKVKNRDVMRKLEKEGAAYKKYDGVIRGIVAKWMNSKKDQPILRKCGNN
jgi:hypothetical protein